MKYVVVTGGVLSGLGIGITASSIGVLLKSAGLRVTSVKIDPYLNCDAGTMSPFEHGEVYVLDDGGEVDLDLGNYERFLDISLTKDHNITTGKVYKSVIERERRGDYLGKTVQVIPHITNEIQEWIERVSNTPSDGTNNIPDACVIELGGTVGDIESEPFIEALRQFQFRVGESNICFVHVSLVPVMGPVGEQKTKPTQHTVKELRGLGIIPDILVCRSENPLDDETREKLAAFCHVSPSAVVSAHDVSNIYRIPILLDEQGVSNVLSKQISFDLPDSRPLLDDWKKMAETVDNLNEVVQIAMVGKYTGLSDSYLSVIKALQHSSFEVNRKLQINWIEAENLDEKIKQENPEKYKEAWDNLKISDGILVPGGFGIRGIEGKIGAIEFLRINKIPFLGICLGLQCAVIEFARNECGISDANSTEFSQTTKNPVIDLLPNQDLEEDDVGASMRLGTYPCKIQPDTMAKDVYNNEIIYERHRHRYEVNNKFRNELESKGLVFSGLSPDEDLVEMIELKDHPYFVASQFHPGFKSRPWDPAPMFNSFIAASKEIKFFDENVKDEHKVKD